MIRETHSALRFAPSAGRICRAAALPDLPRSGDAGSAADMTVESAPLVPRYRHIVVTQLEGM
jgi:hypothetical protein